MHLYKKIYEAINTGIQKALALDDEDVSIIYQHKKIVNNFNAVSYYVDELLQDLDIEYNYEQIIKYYKESGYKYKVKNFDELRNIFDKIKDIKNVSFEWISNMKDYISIVLDDGSEIYINEKTDKKPLFLKLANDNILCTENEILIYLYEDHYIPQRTYQWYTRCVQIQKYQWHTKCVQIQKDEYLIKDVSIAEKDYSGYETCLRIHDIVSKDPDTYGNVPAIDYCLNLNGINGYQGYLPSIGQLRIISANVNIINYVLKFLNFKKLNIHHNNEYDDYWWSSTEYSDDYSWYLCNGKVYISGKVGYNYCVLPLFVRIKN
ncbi:MAG: hypothetical protein [Wendovervirus sonii]|uniref:Uncharacterized protein n=1 Tax=phage Lak_Megaphage_Sonny TaxID=3109229 RepID=A0ABZ0Z257_9CAUD|nr:MAG: hypothetical protein [phage Lak_Megaphage_Sonny]